MIDYSDDDILHGIVHQKHEVLTYIYKKSYEPIRQLVTKNSGDDQDAQDVFQEAIVVVYEKVQNQSLKLECRFSTFLYSVARIIWLKELGRKGRKDEESLQDVQSEYLMFDENIEQDIEKNERLKLFREHFEMLTEDCKKVLHLFIAKVSVAEITERMGYSSEQHTKNRRYRCKKTLIEKIRQNPKFKELANDYNRDDREIPRW